MAPVIVTAGDPAGIGPDLIVRLAPQWAAAGLPVIVAGDAAVLAGRARLIGGDDPGRHVAVLHCPVAVPVRPGRPDPANAGAVLATLDAAVDGCRSGRYRAMVTAPVAKSVIADAGVPFSGHTEWLQARCGVEQVVMLLVAGTLRVALATTHLPLAAVPAAITQVLLRRILDVLCRGLQRDFGLAHPRILVAGLNPHAGEDGHLGREEIDIIRPVCAAYRASARQHGADVVGPLPADTLFTPGVLAGADAVLAMYHDQGLPVLKHVGFATAVNVTLGLPIIRTSVDHGTAFDRAGTGDVDTGSLAHAVALAVDLAGRSAARG